MARTRTDAGEPVVLAVLPALLDQLSALGLKSVSLPIACELARPPLSTLILCSLWPSTISPS
jgi:hypothetical protein